MSDVLLNIALPITLILIMFGMGMTLTLADFLRLKEYPSAIAAGLGGQLILLPLVGAFLAVFWGLQAEFAIGMVILAACPGGTTSNVVSYLARGDRPLSITLTAINSLFVVFTIPIYTALAIQYFAGATDTTVKIPTAQLMFSVFAYTVIPVSLGMLVRRFAPDFTLRFGSYYDRLAAIAFTLIVLLIIWNSQSDLKTILPMVGGITVTLNLVMTGLGFLVAYLLSMKQQQAITLAIEIGIQNTVLGMAVATMLDGVNGMEGQLMLVPCAVYGLIMYGPAVVMILIGRREQSQLAARAANRRAKLAG